LDLPPPSETGGLTGGEECAAYSEQADFVYEPADILVVVDNSGSMDFEAGSVQSNLNAFSAQIIDSGVDARVVLISSYPGDGNGICIDPPLGSGGCDDSDSNPPVFAHVDQRVSSNNALERVLEDYAQWSPTLRPESALHIVVVTDDQSNIGADEFHAEFQLLDPDHADYKLHGIVGVNSDCDEVADVGSVYVDLAALTDGLIHDLCDQNFQPVFDLLATEVISGSTLACEWPIPEPPEGEAFDPNQVNVEFDNGDGNPVTIGRVEAAADCANVDDGWYYDNPAAPTLILVCPQTCEKMQTADDASVSITLGCATQPAG
jgi:hypothetical protein